jgi:restriction system protein
VSKDRESITKYDIGRTVLARLNEKGEMTLGERREILKRVIEFEDFSTCWPSDQLKARGLVAQIRQVVNVKDSFTRMSLEREHERKQRQAEQKAKLREMEKRQATLSAIKADLFALFTEQNAWMRGKKLESILNRLFDVYGILVQEAFTITGSEAEGIVEQIDGVVEIQGELYLVEMKWWHEALGVGDVSQHLVRVYHRGNVRGIFISASGYTDAAITTCKESLSQIVVAPLRTGGGRHAVRAERRFAGLFA